MKELAEAQPRRLVEKDICSAVELSAQAGWNQTSDDWRMLIELAQETCLAIEVNGELASTTALLCYGSKLAWVGMVLTKVKFRGRGLARRLLSEALRLAAQKKIETVKLDATNQGVPLYEQLGFRAEQAVERWERPGTGSAVAADPQANSLSSAVMGADHEAFGADRSQLLRELATRNPPLVAGKAYLLARSGSRTAYLGPCVSEDARIARSLIERYARSTTAAIAWDLLQQNRDAKAIANDLGFSQKRVLTRMVRGKDLRGCEDRIYALGGFEFG